MKALWLRIERFERSRRPFLPQIHFPFQSSPPLHGLLHWPKTEIHRLGQQERHPVRPNIIVHFGKLQFHTTILQIQFCWAIRSQCNRHVLSQERPERSVAEITGVDINLLNGNERTGAPEMILMVFAHAFHDFVHAEKDCRSEESVVKDTSFVAKLGDHLVNAFGMIGVGNSRVNTTARDVG